MLKIVGDFETSLKKYPPIKLGTHRLNNSKDLSLWRCPLLALSCRAGQRLPRQLSGVKRTSQLNRAAAANDPKRILPPCGATGMCDASMLTRLKREIQTGERNGCSKSIDLLRMEPTRGDRGATRSYRESVSDAL